jgi:N-acetyltransferase
MNDFDLQPRLSGDFVELRPLCPDDWEDLFAVASDPQIWEQHPAFNRYKEEIFKEFFREALESGGAFVILDRRTRRVIGSTRFAGYDREKRQVEIGWTFLARSYWGGRYNGEVKRLMLEHAFNYVDTVFFLVGPNNRRSRRALEKIGAVYAGKETADVDGQPMELVRYEIRRTGASA